MAKAYRKFTKKKTKQPTEKTAAVLTIHGPGLMNDAGRRDIAAWLEVQALNLRIDGYLYTDKRFTARYLYR